MKAEFEKQTLAKALQVVAKTAPVRPTIPSLRGVKIVVDNGATLTTSNQETTTTTTVNCDVQEAGVVLVPAKIMAEIIPKLPNKPVVLETADNALRITCGSSSFTLPAMNIDDYPPTPDLPEYAGVIDSGEFARCVSTVDVAASNDDTLPMLTGIHILATPDSMRFTATDRFRLGMNYTGWDGAEFTALVPNKAAIDVARLCDRQPLSIHMGEGVAGFVLDGTQIITRLLYADFPKVEGLLSKTHENWARINRKNLIESVKRVNLISRTVNRMILEIGANSMTITASATEDGSATETIECEANSGNVSIAFNPTYVIGGLSAMDTEEIVIGYSEPTRPCTIYPGTVETGDTLTPPEGIALYLLMPVRL